MLYQLLPSGICSGGHKQGPKRSLMDLKNITQTKLIYVHCRQPHVDSPDLSCLNERCLPQPPPDCPPDHARTSMGISGSRDDLIAFLNANSSKEWRNQKGDRRNPWSAKDVFFFFNIG